MRRLLIATATVLLLVLCAGHRSGRISLLGKGADFAARISGLPHWAALPLGLGGASLNVALLGMYWDISLHIDDGRDAGPLANPAHYLILAGLFGIFAAGILAISLPRDGERPGPRSVRIAEGWYAPIGGLLSAAAALVLGGGAAADAAKRVVEARELTCAACGGPRCEFVASRRAMAAAPPSRAPAATPPPRTSEA